LSSRAEHKVFLFGLLCEHLGAKELQARLIGIALWQSRLRMVLNQVLVRADIVATQSISSLKEALPNEGVKTLLQAFRTKIFLSTADPDTAQYASELCGKADKTRISYTVSESSNNANVGWLSGRTSSNKGSVSASKQYMYKEHPLTSARPSEKRTRHEIVCAKLRPVPAIVTEWKEQSSPYEDQLQDFARRSL
jgi:hypothetical protein